MLIGDYALDGTPVRELSKASEKRVNVKCDGCEKKYTIIWHNYKLSQKRRGNNGLTFCKPCALKESGKKSMGRVPWNKGHEKPQEERKRKDYTSVDGYLMTYSPDSDKDSKSKWASYKKLHRVLMEKELGRSLRKNERVHHLDGVKTNNTVENLWLADGHSRHRKAHTSLQDVGYELYRKGLVIFDKKEGIYKIKGDV